MKVTKENRKLLRNLLHETIPEYGAVEDTRFEDDVLDLLLEGADNIYRAASEGWLMKAGMYQEEMQDLRTTRVGMETYEMTRLMDRYDYAESMSLRYKERAEQGGSLTGTGTLSALMLSAKRDPV